MGYSFKLPAIIISETLATALQCLVDPNDQQHVRMGECWAYARAVLRAYNEQAAAPMQLSGEKVVVDMKLNPVDKSDFVGYPGQPMDSYAESAKHLYKDPWSPTNHLKQFFAGLRASGSVFQLSDAEMIVLLRDAVDAITPDNALADEARDQLASDLSVIVGHVMPEVYKEQNDKEAAQKQRWKDAVLHGDTELGFADWQPPE